MNKYLREWEGEYFVLLNEDKVRSAGLANKLKTYGYFPSFIAYLDCANDTMRFTQYTGEKTIKIILIPYDWIEVMFPMEDRVEKFKEKLKEEDKPFIYSLWELCGRDEKTYMTRLKLPAYRVLTWKDSDDEREREEMNE